MFEKNEKPITEQKVIAILWMIATDRDVKTSAARAGVTPEKLQHWIDKDKDFRERYDEMWARHLGVGKEERRRANEYIVSELYNTVFRKIEAGELEGMPVKELVTAIKQLNVEMRLPAVVRPGAGDRKVERQVNNEVNERFKKAQKRRSAGGEENEQRLH